jgi:cytochrome P450
MMASHAHSACPVHVDFDPLSPTFLADPFAALASLPRETPVFYAPSIDYYVVTRYADIKAVFLDPETYSAAPAQLPLAQLVYHRRDRDHRRWNDHANRLAGLDAIRAGRRDQDQLPRMAGTRSFHL